jgi:hypothetical protein
VSSAQVRNWDLIVVEVSARVVFVKLKGPVTAETAMIFLRLNQFKQNRVAAESTNCVDAFVYTIPTSVWVVSPVFVSTPFDVDVLWLVVDTVSTGEAVVPPR